MNEQLKRFAEQSNIYQEYRHLSVAFEGAINCVLGALKIVEHEQTSEGGHSPMHSITSRVKSYESSQKKLKRHGLPFTIENVVNRLNDVAGVRVICKYISDIYLVRDMLLASRQFVLVKEKDYIRNPKPSGYRSLHLIVETDVHLSGGVRKVRCEIQLRTSAMDSWASLEHTMRYKSDLPENEQIDESLKNCAEALYNTDLEMQRIAHQLGILSDEQYIRYIV